MHYQCSTDLVPEQRVRVNTKAASVCAECGSGSPIADAQACGFAVARSLDDGQPPSSNTGVEMTGGVKGQGVSPSMCVDWVTFSFPDGVSHQQASAFLGLTLCRELSHGRHGYRSAVAQGNVTILHSGATQGMGVCVEVSGSGCRELEASGRVTDWLAFLREVVAYGGRFSRIDIAFDERSGILDLGTMQDYYLRGLTSSHFRKFQVIRSYASGEGGANDTGTTLQFGSPKSSVLIRAYDKAKEQGQEGHWIRVEVQVRGANARALVALAVSQGEQVFSGYLASLLEFKEEGSGEIRSRWQVASWWAAFLGQVSKVRLCLGSLAPSIERLWHWLITQVAPSLALIRSVAGRQGFEQALTYLVDEGMPKVKPWKLAALRQEGGLA